MGQYYIGVDVGTGSARAGVFDSKGTLRGMASHGIAIWKQDGDIVEQSSDDIWRTVCASVHAAMAASGCAPEQIGGIGFDATCSLVVLDPQGAPLPAGPSGKPVRNVIVWMDQRATDQANRINAGGHEVLRYVGGRISPEMQTPKLLWLAENMPETFARAGMFFDLPDFLTWRATGDSARSLCTTTCKWTYLGHERRWDPEYFHAIGLGALADEGFSRIGDRVVDVATPLGTGLTPQAAGELGLLPETPVGAALIDAHAGGVGSLGGRLPTGQWADPMRQVAAILGTSSCTMAAVRKPVFVDGVWGPYFGAMLPGVWLNEGGQSAFGAALDHLATLHPAGAEARKRAQAEGVAVPALLERIALDVTGGNPDAAVLAARNLHVVPEFLGNRAPDADPRATAVLTGLRLGDDSIAGLARLHVAGLCGLAYGLARIIEAQQAKGMKHDSIVVSGGIAKSAFARRVIADATGLSVLRPASEEPVLLGAAMLGATASGRFSDLDEAAGAMCAYSEVLAPADGPIRRLHDRKRRAHDELLRSEREVRRIMCGESRPA